MSEPLQGRASTSVKQNFTTQKKGSTAECNNDKKPCDPGWYDDGTSYTVSWHGTDLTFTGADLNMAARVVFAEASGTAEAVAGNYTSQLGNERLVTAAAIFNRIGVSGYPTREKLQTLTAVVNASNQYESVFNNTRKFANSDPSSKGYSKLSDADCNDLRAAMNAVKKLMTGKGYQPSATFQLKNDGNTKGWHVIGGSKFK
jgi:hypothetical protein